MSRSRKIIVSTVVIVTVLCVGVYGYLASLQSSPCQRVTLTSPPIQFSMTLDKTRYSFTDNMTITFYLKNTSNETVTWRKGDKMYNVDPVNDKLTTVAEGVTAEYGEYALKTWFHFGYIMYFGNGTVFDEEYVGELKSAYDIVFEPNGSLNQTLCMSLTLHDPNNPSRSAGHLLEKGTYRIGGVIYPIINSSEPYLQSPNGLCYLETPTISFSIF